MVVLNKEAKDKILKITNEKVLGILEDRIQKGWIDLTSDGNWYINYRYDDARNLWQKAFFHKYERQAGLCPVCGYYGCKQEEHTEEEKRLYKGVSQEEMLNAVISDITAGLHLRADRWID